MFGGRGEPVAGATVSVLEFPGLETQTDEGGFYELRVPASSELTPIVRHPEYVEMRAESLSGTLDDFTFVNLQMVSPQIYDLLAAALQTEPSPDHCQIATTVSVDAIFGLTLEEFAAFGHHGVEGAVVRSDPPVPEIIYTSDFYVPDRSLSSTSVDGGVTFPNVPPGDYVFWAEHPDRSFRSFSATCEAGVLINAGPPWGLHEIGD